MHNNNTKLPRLPGVLFPPPSRALQERLPETWSPPAKDYISQRRLRQNTWFTLTNGLSAFSELPVVSPKEAALRWLHFRDPASRGGKEGVSGRGTQRALGGAGVPRDGGV